MLKTLIYLGRGGVEEGFFVCLCSSKLRLRAQVDLKDMRREFRWHEGDARKEGRDAVERRVGRDGLKISVRRR